MEVSGKRTSGDAQPQEAEEQQRVAKGAEARLGGLRWIRGGFRHGDSCYGVDAGVRVLRDPGIHEILKVGPHLKEKGRKF
jgi:hypothetical protein